MQAKNIQISELAFKIVEHSEVMEGFDFNNYNTKSEELKYINREIYLKDRRKSILRSIFFWRN